MLAAHQLAEWGHPHGTETHDTVVLVVAELAANSVLHGRVPGRDFALLLSRDDSQGFLRIEVTDTHPAQPVRRTPGPDEDRGRGLLLVDALAACWGVSDRLGPGKTSWAECNLGSGSKRPKITGAVSEPVAMNLPSGDQATPSPAALETGRGVDVSGDR